MHSKSGDLSDFELFDLAGVGIARIDAKGLVSEVSESFLHYMEIDRQSVLGQDSSVLREGLVSKEFWEGLGGDGNFRCLVPARHHLLLTVCRASGDGDKLLLLRPYSLEREFIRMRSRLNRNVVVEISEHLSSIAVAGEIILQPELQDDKKIRTRFLESFFRDIQDLGLLFEELQEIAEPIPFPNRVRPTPIDWKSLVTDLLEKMRGFSNEKNVSLAGGLPESLPTANGDFQWLSLALFGILHHAVMEAPSLGEVTLGCRSGDELETTIVHPLAEGSSADEWPPQTLFPMPGGKSGGGTPRFSDLALSRSIFLLLGGEVERSADEESARFVIRLPL